MRGYLYCAAAVVAPIALFFRVLPVNATTVALFLLLTVLWAATKFGLSEAIFTSVLAVLGFNFFFLPPVGTFTIADPENWVALFAFLATAVTVSKLSATARRRAEEAEAGRNEIATLYELSRAMLMDEARDAVRVSVAKTGEILHLEHIAFFDLANNQMYGSVDGTGVAESEMLQVAESGQTVDRGRSVVVPVRLGAHTVGSLAMQGPRLSKTTLDSIASLLAINYERVRALDRAAAAEIARRNEEFKSSLLDGLAHDLKTPLTAIRTCVTRLIAIPPRTEEVRQELLSIIDQESGRLQQTISEAVELARIESQELRLKREDTSVRDLLQSAVEETRDESAERYSVRAGEDFHLNVDGPLLRRALLQVLENARKYSPPGSPIEIEAGIESDCPRIVIMDRGAGIRPDEMEKIFEKFYRGRRIPGSAVEGTGMGLAIAKAIVEAHGGSIRAERRQAGGTIIRMTLPAQTVIAPAGSHVV